MQDIFEELQKRTNEKMFKKPEFLNKGFFLLVLWGFQGNNLDFQGLLTE